MVATSKPTRQVCPICAFDEVEIVKTDDDEWVMICQDSSHPPYEWRPTIVQAALSGRSGIAQELGVYDDLLECVIDGVAEYGVIEYRFSQHAPGTYRTLLRRYGHTALTAKRYTTSAFLGGALGQLWRESAIEGRWAPATGYWSYNSQVGAYGPPGTTDDADVLSWAQFAQQTLQIDPLTWPFASESESDYRSRR